MPKSNLYYCWILNQKKMLSVFLLYANKLRKKNYVETFFLRFRETGPETGAEKEKVEVERTKLLQ